MLSYMLPATQPPAQTPAGAGAGARLALELAPRPARTNISKESSTSSFASDLTMSSSTPTGAIDKPKHKLLGNGTKHTSLKRVSFGSSKGSMVETLIYESPLQEEPECSPPPKLYETAFPYSPAEEDSERSKVRVSFYQGARPQCVSPPLASLPESQVYTPLLVPDMADHGAYNRQISTESGWDNPFRPDGDLSREADEIVSLIKGGKPITPTPTAAPQLAVDETDQIKHTANNLSANGPAAAAAAGAAANGASPAHVDVQRAPAQQPLQPEHVTIKKKPKCKCCVVQ